MKNPDKASTRADAHVPASGEIFRRIFETSRDGILFLNAATGIVMDANPAAQILLGASREMLVGKPLQDIEILNEVPAILSPFQESQKKKTIRHHGLVLHGNDGRQTPVELTGNAYKVGKQRMIQLTLQGPADPGQAKEPLEEMKQELQRFFNLTIDLLCIANTEGHFLYLNPAWQRTLGFSEKELMRKPFISFVHPEDVASTRQAVERLVSQQEVIDFVNRYRCKDGSYRWLEWHSKPAGNLIYAAAHDISDRRQAEVALQKSEEQFRLLAETSFDMITRHGPDGTYLYVSPACRNLLGYEPEELIGHSAFEFIHPDDRAEVKRMRTQILGKKENTILSFRVRRKDGSDVWVESNSHVVKDRKTGNVTEIQVTTRDVTERKKAEGWLNLLKRSIDSSPDSAYWLDRDGRFIYANEAGCKALGYNQDELLQMRVEQVNPGATPERWAEVWKILREKKYFTSESIHCRKDGSTFPVEISSTHVKLEDQEYCNGFARDISERKQAEEALRASEIRYRTLAEAAHDMIFIIDRLGRVEYVNDFSARQIGHHPAEIIGQPLANLFPPQVSTRQQTNLEKVFKTAEPLYVENEADFMQSRKWLGTWLAPIRNDNGEVDSVLGISRDITERILAEEALKESERRYRDLFENAVLGIFQSTPSGKILAVNPAFAHMFGYTSPEEVRQSINDIATEIFADPHRRAEILRLMAEDPARDTFENVYRRKDGSTFTGTLHLRLVNDSDNVLSYLEGFVEDITARKHAEEALRESETKYRAVIETTDTGYVVLDESGRVIDANLNYVRLTGHQSVEEILGREATEWTAEHDLERNRQEVIKSIETGSTRYFEVDYRHPDGTIVPVEINASVITTNSGKRIVTLCRDISARKQAEHALRDSEWRNQIITQLTTDYIFVVEVRPHGKLELVWASDSMKRLTGRGVEDAARSDTWDNIIHPDDREHFYLFIKQTLNTAQTGELECRTFTKSGDERWIQILVQPQTGEGKKVEKIIGAIKDISDRKRAEQALRESEEKFSTAFRTSPDSININRLSDGMYLEINQGFTQLTGYTSDDVKGKTSFEIDIWAIQSDRENLVKELRERGEVTNLETQFRLKDGTVKTGLMSARLIVVNNESCILSITRDISERKQVEQALQLSEERMRAIVDAAPFGAHSYELRPDNRLVFIGYNRSADQILGIEHAPLLGKTIESAFPALIGTPVPDAYRRVATGGIRLDDEQVQYDDGKIHGAFELHAFQTGTNRMSVFFRDITERKKAEEKISLVNERLNLATRAAHLGIWDWDVKNNRLVWDDRMFELYGIDKQDFSVAYETWINEVHPEDVARCEEEIQLALRGEKEYDIEFRVVWPDGTVKHIRAYGQVIRDLDGTPLRMTGVNYDITARALAEEELFNSQQMLRTVLDTIPQRVFWKDRNLVYVGCNKSLALDSGFDDPEEMIGKTDYDTTTTSMADLYRADDRHIIETGLPKLNYEEPQRKSDGSQGWLVTSKVPLRDKDGRVIGVLGTYEDITDRKRAEDALRKSEQFLRASQKVAGIGSYDLDTLSGIWISSPILDDIFGIDATYPHNIEGWLALVHPDFRAAMDSHFSIEVIQNGHRFDREYMIVRQNDGAVRWVHGLGDLEMDQDGNVVRMVGTIQDITDRKQAEVALENQAEELRRRNSELARLYRASGALLSGTFTNPVELANKIVHIVLQDFGKSNCSLLLARENSNILERIALDGPYARQVGKKTLFLDGNGLVPHAIRTGQIVNVADVRLNPDYVSSWNEARSELTIPLKIGEMVIGAIDIQSAEPGAFSADDVRVMGIFTEQAALAMENAILFEAEQRRLNRLAALQRLATELAGIHNRRELLDTLVVRAAALAESATSAVLLIDADTQEAVLAAQTGLGGMAPASLRIPLKTKILQDTLLAGDPLIVPDIDRDAPELRGLLVRTDIRAFYAYPLMQNGNIAGIITLSSLTPRMISEGESTTYQLLAKLASAALDNVDLFEETNNNLQRLASLRAVDMVIASSFDTRLTLSVLLEQLITQLRVDAAAILTYNPLLFTLRVECSQGFRIQPPSSTENHIGEGLPGQVVRERRIIHIPNLQNQVGSSPMAVFVREEKFTSYFGVPIIAKGQIKGVLEIYNKGPIFPDPDWLDFLDMLAGQAAIAIDNAELFNNLQRSNSELSMAYDDTLEGWASALDLRDKETQGHTRRVTDMTIELARVMNLRDVNLLHVRWGALLHDIGKMGVPDEILRKPEALTDEEWIIMRQHPQFAYDMLAHISYLRPALDIPYCHHEKWDGSGYPRGLAGDQIPITARIFSIVDVWDALLSDRPYRKAWPHDKVLEYIRAQVGKQFDPVVVRVFLDAVAEKWRP